MKQFFTTRYITQAALIAAAYAALTLLLAPISYSVMQVRISEALCVLARFTPAAVPGLCVGCLIANLLGPNGVWDVILGTLATVIGVVGIRLLKDKNFFIAMLPNIISNAVIIGLCCRFLWGEQLSVIICMLLVGAGEAIACYVPGFVFYKALTKLDTDLIR